MECHFPLMFETKSGRVNGISFHPTGPWVLAALDNGIIQYWNYQRGILLKNFDGHAGQVRGVCFHMKNPIFVSGGDDAKIKVWNYDRKQCIKTMAGHLDRVRTTFFHLNKPWIISASDDKTARIWNWKTGKCIAILTGHGDKVMCAQFHDTEDFIVTASLDRTVRALHISRLKIDETSVDEASEKIGTFKFMDLTDENAHMYMHCRGVNWATFHRTDKYFLTASDNIKLFCLNEEEKIKLLDVYTEHKDSISTVVFHPNKPQAISCSEDKTIRVFNVDFGTCMHAFKRESYRFCSLAAHPMLNIFAAGHENGMVVFKLERERPAYCVYGDLMYYVMVDEIRRWDLTNETNEECWEFPFLCQLAEYFTPHSLSMNSDESALILVTRAHNRVTCTFDVYSIQSTYGDKPIVSSTAISAFWVDTNRFVVLNDSKQIYLRNWTSEEIHKLDCIDKTVYDIFFAGSGMLLLKTEDGLELYDFEQNNVRASVKVNGVRYVIWSESMEYAALLSKNVLTLVNRKLEILCAQQESLRVKSGAWDGDSVFVYNTRNQIKYLTTSGDCGTIKTYYSSLYILNIRKSTIYGLNTEAIAVQIPFDLLECKLKLALGSIRIDEALDLMKLNHFRISRTGYLTCFRLALDSGNHDAALKAAERLDEADHWKVLAEIALLQGNYQIAEICYQKTENFEKLTFLYFVTGNTEKLVEMMKNAEARNDSNAHFEITLLIGNVEERIRVLRKCGQTCLAHLAATVHGYIDEPQELEKELELRGPPLPEIERDAKLLVPPLSVFQLGSKWPLSTSTSNGACPPSTDDDT